ncbi:hypothetical protein BDB01DRAFT_769886 [Pilobolus umbonatus]|nr:hypothetical protein BDB01DRAFT_769886 [Pilobolus umbonatus]
MLYFTIISELCPSFILLHLIPPLSHFSLTLLFSKKMEYIYICVCVYTLCAYI